jgi:hypothetical protein
VRDDSTRWDDTYVMVADIDMGTCIWDSPIAPSYWAGGPPPFTGDFDGNGRTLSGLTVAVDTKSIDDSRVNLAGFMGHLDDGGRIHNMVFDNATVTFDDTKNYDDSAFNSSTLLVGVAAGYVDDITGVGGSVENVTVMNSTVTVFLADTRLPATGLNWRRAVVGGVVGEAWMDSVTGLNTENNVIQNLNYQVFGANESQTGGIVGAMNGEVHDFSSTDDSITSLGNYSAGGAILGELWRGSLADVRVTRPEVLVLSSRNALAGGAIGGRYGSGATGIEVTDGSVSAQNTVGGGGWFQAGGAIGETSGGYALDMDVRGTMISSQGNGFVNAGGVIGLSYDDTVAQLSADSTASSRSSGDDSSYASAGGLIGWYWPNGASDMLSSSYASGDATAWSDDTGGEVWAGGLIGFIDQGTVTQSYSTGNAQATALGPASQAEAGGLVGATEGDIIESFSTGSAVASGVADDTVGGLVGVIYAGTVSQSYWNTSTSGIMTSAGGSGLTATQMQDPASFAGWTIVDGWQAQTFTGIPAQPAAPFWGQCTTNPGSPFLLWQHTVSPCSAPVPPTPSPIPPSEARDVTATPGDRSAVVSWLPPISSGSFRVTTYEVVMNGSDPVCLVPASTDDTQSCSVEDLINGEEYTFTVRALSGAGWSAFSTPSDPVVPRAASIVITGSREGRSVEVAGDAPGLVGEQVTPWIRFPGPHRYQPGAGVQTVSDDGTFTWQRRTGKKTYVYFRAGDDIRSNRVIIPARR